MKIKDFAQNLVEKIENVSLSFWGAILLLYGFIFIRTFLENYANSLNIYHMSNVGDTFFHYPVFFLIIFLASFIIGRILTKENIEKVAKVIILFSFVVITPPVVDLIVHKGKLIPYIFISGSFSQLFSSFVTYLGGGAIGVGIRTEVALVLLGFGFYIFHKTKEIKKSFIGIFFLYLAIFTMLASPALVFSLQNAITKEYKTVNLPAIADFYYRAEPQNSNTSNRTFITNPSAEINFYNQESQRIQNQYSVTLAIIFLILSVALSAWCLFLYSSKKFFSMLKNFRYLRILHYFLMIFFGIYIGANFINKNPIGSMFDLVSFISLFLSVFFAWLFAVWENDEADIEIDKISSPDRPLAKEEGSPWSLDEWKNLKFVFLLYSLSFAFLSGFYSFVFILLYIFIYHIYSTPPFRLKRFLGISSLLIAVNALLSVWMGFFMSVGTENLNAFPAKYTFGILIIFLLVENLKNIKDIEGDRIEGIKTLPVILGEKKGKLVIGICIFLATLLVPIIFFFSLYTFFSAIIFGALLFWLTNKKNFQENYVFIVYLLYVLVFLFLIRM